jgi:integrase
VPKVSGTFLWHTRREKFPKGRAPRAQRSFSCFVIPTPTDPSVNPRFFRRVALIETPFPSRETLGILLPDEGHHLLMAEIINPMIVTQAALGLRVAELLALRVQDVDFMRDRVRVEFQLTQNGLDRVDPKTPRSRRTLPLPQVVKGALAAHITEFPPAKDGSLFTTERGNLYRQEHYGARIFAPAVRKAGLPEGVTSHDLRHHFASVMLQATGNPMLVAEMLGHENASLVLKVYGHLMPGSEGQMRRVIDAAWSETGQKPVKTSESRSESL